MSGFDHLDLIWLSELNLAVIYSVSEAPGDFVAAAIILKGADGTDLFIPYEGYVEGAPISFSIGRSEMHSIRVIGFGPATEPEELAVWTFNRDLQANKTTDHSKSSIVDMNLLGFGERSRDWQGSSQYEIGFNTVEYALQGEVEYNDLLETYLQDMRRLDEETFTSYFVTASPQCQQDDGEKHVGPALHLRPMHHFNFGLSVQCHSVETYDESGGDDDGRSIYGAEEDTSTAFDGAAILSRHGGFEFRDVPEFILNAGTGRDQVDFILRNGFHIHWRRQLENWANEEGQANGLGALGDGQIAGSFDGGGSGTQASFTMAPFSERNHLFQHEGHNFLRWDLEDAIPGDVVGLAFSAEEASLEIDLNILGDRIEQTHSDILMFIFMGDMFVPLTQEILEMPENLGVSARLQDHIDKGLQSQKSSNSLKNERIVSAKGLLERDVSLQEIFKTEQLQDLAAIGPFGPEFMVYRDHILRVCNSVDMSHWMNDLSFASPNVRRGKLIDTLRFETFCKAPQLAHALVFNQSFRQKFQSKPIDPHSFNMPVLEYLMSKLYSDPVIDWAMRLKGESQAILWHLVLKRPDMVERLYDLKLEPDIALNPFDDLVLSHVETALNDSSQINVELIEKKVIPIFKTMGDEVKVKDLTDFAHALNFGAEGKALSLGELSVCLAAVERASDQWDEWRGQVGEIFQPLVDPLIVEVPHFDSDIDFVAAQNIDDKRGVIGNLVERLGKELELGDDLVRGAIEFVHKIESDVLLEGIANKLDLALKYHRDLSVGVETLYGEFDVSSEDLELIKSIDADEWPKLDEFTPEFADPLIKQQRSKKSSFNKLIKGFAHKVHPNDDLFHQTLVNALDELEEALPLLHWLEVGQEMEQRVDIMQKRLKNALLKVNPASIKLRRSRVISEAVKEIVIAERLGPSGWPLLTQSLDVIEQDLPKDLI